MSTAGSSSTRSESLEPFVDTHIHLYDLVHPGLKYNWLEAEATHSTIGNIDGIKTRRYSVENFIAESRFQNVKAAVHVQAAIGSLDPVEETAWIEGERQRSGIPTVTVAYSDLTAPTLQEELDRHSAAGQLVGVRDFGRGEPFDHPNYLRGLRTLGKRGLVACMNVDHSTFHQLANVASRLPSTEFCVDHAGFPKKRDAEYFEAWRHGLASIAQHDNVFIKISGLGMVDHRWTISSIEPWVLAAIEIFGVERCVFGSNWPVDRLFSSYSDLVDAYRHLVGRFSVDERRALLADNAIAKFRMPAQTTSNGSQ